MRLRLIATILIAGFAAALPAADRPGSHPLLHSWSQVLQFADDALYAAKETRYTCAGMDAGRLYSE